MTKVVKVIKKVKFNETIFDLPNYIFNFKMHLGKNIKFLRKKLKVNQSEIGERVGVSKAAISSYEGGGSVPGIDTLIQLAMVFEVSIDDLLLRDIEKTGTSDKPIQITKEIDDEKVMTINKLMEHRIRELEREIKANNPDLAIKLGIE